MTNGIAFLLGAGASYPYGVPMMAGFYDDFTAYVRRRHAQCSPLLDNFDRQMASQPRDLETLLTYLQLLVGTNANLTALGMSMPALGDQVTHANELRGYLDAFIIDTCERFNTAKAVAELGLIQNLVGVSPLWIFSTNYDRIIEHVCQQLDVRYDDGFEQESGKAVADWTGTFDAPVRIIKLHGSVNWYVDDPGGSLHRLDRGYSVPAHDFRLVRGDQRLQPLMIIPTLEKQVLDLPYIQLSLQFTDVLKETKLLIVAGNSLRDSHIRNQIIGRLPHLRVLLVSPSASSNRGILNNLNRTHCLPAGFSEFLTLGRSALLSLVERLSDPNCDDAAVADAVEGLIGAVSAGITDDAALTASPELAAIWAIARDGGVSQRARAMEELTEHAHPAVVRRIEEALRTDGDAAVRVAAVGALLKLQGQGAAQNLAKALIEDLSPDVQMESALAITQLRSEVAIDGLLRPALERAGLGIAVRAAIEEALDDTSPVPTQ